MSSQSASTQISLKDLARYTDELNFQKTYNAIRRRASRGYYKTYVKIKGEGFVDVNDEAIEEALRLKLQMENADRRPETAIQPAASAGALHGGLQSPVSLSLDELTPEEEKFALAKANVIKMYLEYMVNYGKSISVRRKFVELYNHKAFPQQFEQTGKIGSWKTIERWKYDYLNAGSDYRVLARKKIKRNSSVPPAQAEVIIKLALNPNKPLLSEVIKTAKDIFIIQNHTTILHKSTYARFLNNWKNENYADWVFFREGEQALDNKILPFIERDYERIQVGDILIMDGHVNNYDIINPLTGKPKRMMTIGALDMKSNFLCGYDIQPTENTFAIAVAIRRAILNLGKTPRIIYFDNGRAFGAKYFHGDEMQNIEALFGRLNIKVIFAKAYHGQSKTIEPFWKWMSELERMMPTYTGTSIEMQPPRMNRGEKLHVKLYEKMMDGVTVDIYTAHKAMAWWLDKYHSRIQEEGHMKGLSPNDLFLPNRGPGVNKQELTYLMMQQQIKKVYRNGIKLFNTSYWNEALFGKNWDEVLVRYDLLERGSIFVYDLEGKFICEAFEWTKEHPAAGILGNEDDVKSLHDKLRLKESLKKGVVAPAKEFLKKEIYPAVKNQFQNMIEAHKEEEELIEEKPAKKKTKESLSSKWKFDDDNF